MPVSAETFLVVPSTVVSIQQHEQQRNVDAHSHEHNQQQQGGWVSGWIFPLSTNNNSNKNEVELFPLWTTTTETGPARVTTVVVPLVVRMYSSIPTLG